HSKPPGPGAEDATQGGETESLGVSSSGQAGQDGTPASRAPRSPSGAFVPDAITDLPRPATAASTATPTAAASSKSRPAPPAQSRGGADPRGTPESVSARRKAERKLGAGSVTAAAAETTIPKGMVPEQTGPKSAEPAATVPPR